MEHFIEMKIPFDCACALFDVLHSASRVGTLNSSALQFKNELYSELLAINFERRFYNEKNDEKE